jgi:tetratricopeptide (TPR) repeat protein
VAQKADLIVLRLVAALGFFWARFAFWQEAQDWLERALEAAPPEPSRARADALYYAGMVAWYRGDRDVAESRLDEALSLFRAVGDARDIGVVLNQRAISAYTRGDYPGAIALLDESISLLLGQDLPEYLAYALYLRGIVARIQGDFTLARTLGEESLRLSETGKARGSARGPRLKFVLMSERRRMANILDSLGVLALYQGDYAEARTRSEAALAIAREDDWFFMIVSAMNTLSLVAARTGRQDEAERQAEEALAMARERGMKGGVARALLVLGRVARARGDFARAAACYGEGLSTFMELRERLGAIQSLERFADLAAARGEPGASAALFGAAEAAREALGAPLPPADRDELNGAMAVLRDRLSLQELESAWKAGRQRTLEECAQLASALSAPIEHDP